MSPRHAEEFARGTGLFLGAFTCMDAFARARGAAASQSLWLLDAGALSPVADALLPGVLGGLMVWQSLAPAAPGPRRRLTVAVCAFAALVAGLNATDFYAAWGAGAIAPVVPVPLSVFVAVVFAALAWWSARRAAPAGDGTAGRPPASGSAGATAATVARIALVVGAWALVFPLAQIAFFGTTDYRRPADAVIVLGARVWPDGRLTTSLEDRVRTACDLYHEGLAEKLVMSGGVGAEGVDEAVAMRDRAITLGVPADAVEVDSAGFDTDATVANSLAIADREGLDRLLVVSQFYHLPRIELAYRAQGREVFTVPATRSRSIAKTPLFVAREIPGFWLYWGRAWLRDVRGSAHGYPRLESQGARTALGADGGRCLCLGSTTRTR